MFHIGIATQHPPLPEKGQLSELGIDFVEKCLDIDPLKRPTAGELMEHPWIVAFSQEIAREMSNQDGQLQDITEEQEEAEELDESSAVEYNDNGLEGIAEEPVPEDVLNEASVNFT